MYSTVAGSPVMSGLVTTHNIHGEIHLSLETSMLQSLLMHLWSTSAVCKSSASLQVWSASVSHNSQMFFKQFTQARNTIV